MNPLGWSARVLGFHLGLGDLNRGETCHGYANCCTCSECLERAQRKPKKPAPQPWETAA